MSRPGDRVDVSPFALDTRRRTVGHAQERPDEDRRAGRCWRSGNNIMRGEQEGVSTGKFKGAKGHADRRPVIHPSSAPPNPRLHKLGELPSPPKHIARASKTEGVAGAVGRGVAWKVVERGWRQPADPVLRSRAGPAEKRVAAFCPSTSFSDLS